ncbi:hypothetical protein [Psychroflexus sediminis]|uniref:Uncharacterized protein n=1 Tax=Psychroflexus sediminis TaxID=470826 RepID=A0A1G7YMK7_9FLAO|nr:hypothetical protein [Psychroflexus sediminis]SDG97060.1 hypothetical protein SAMN04488027_11310 [Psychroflexus sediminis]
MSLKDKTHIKPWEDASKSEEQVHLADMHGDGVHFNREIKAKAKRDKQLAKEKAEKGKKKKDNKKKSSK